MRLIFAQNLRAN